MKQYLWTLDGGRLQYQSAHLNSEMNWIFIPGGPGLGSEALASLTALLKDKIPGVIWHFDLPNDGSNVLKDKPISNWRASIVQATKAFNRVILVAHSTPGMYVQTMPELEGILHGLVLIGSAPDSSWQKSFAAYCKHNTTPLITEAEKKYIAHPNDENLRSLLIAAAKNCFISEKSLLDGTALFKKIPVNHAASEQASKHFDAEKYIANWVPKNMPTLITTGSMDHITPLNLYSNHANYQRKNILIREISDAGHYPWFENPTQVMQVFQEYAEKFNHHPTGLF
jgi:pimeloyl-ACP methyl ester carboxylesterase